MDALIAAAGHALARGDILGALKRVALRDDPPALALRGIAMAQLGDLERARILLKKAARAFGTREPVAWARCVVAEAEIALVSRDLSWPQDRLSDARQTLERRADLLNAAHARHLEARRLLLLGQFDAAEDHLQSIDRTPLTPVLSAAHALVWAGIAMRRLRPGEAREAIALARNAAEAVRMPALTAEIDAASALLAAQSARIITRHGERRLSMDGVEEVLSANHLLVIDACRNAVRGAGTIVSLASRPVLFALLRTLAECWPDEATRGLLLARAFGARFTDESHRARLRVEIARLRALLGSIASVEATRQGFALVPPPGIEVAVLALPVEERHPTLMALLADGEAWSSSALATVLDVSTRTVQRNLEELAADGKVESFGKGPAQRWITPPLPGFPTLLLLPGPLPGS
ncbi:helix-turn-helix domain-containing protein [Devosia sp. CAU 1758]